MWTLVKSTIVLLCNFSSSDTKTSLPHFTRSRIRGQYTKRQFFFQSAFRLLFSSMVQQVRRYFHKTPVVSIAYSVLLFLLLRVAITVVIASTFHTTGLLALAEGLDALSVSVVRLSRNSYTICSLTGLLHWVSVATDRIVGLSLMVVRSLKTQRWLVIWDCLTHVENASLCNDQRKGRWAGRPSLEMSASAIKTKITHSF